MKKWIWLTVIGLFVLLGIGINIYLNAVEPVKNARSIASKIAIEETEIVQVDDFSIYNGSETYFIVRGSDESGEKLIAWIPEEHENERIIVKEAKKGITKEDAIQKLRESKEFNEIIAIKLGMEKRIPLWEIFYRSKNDLINYYYIDFETGEWLKDIQNL